MTKKADLPKPVSLYWFLLFAVVFFVQVFPRLGMDSPTGDEMVDIADGFYYWNGDVISDSRHPPLAKALQALPLRFMGMETKTKASFTNYERRDYNFLFVLNRTKFESAVRGARCVSLFLGLGLGWLLFLTVRDAGRAASIATLAFWALEPNLLAFSGFAMADLPLTFFYFLAVYSFRKLLEIKGGWKEALRTGVLTGMAITAKFSAVVLIPVFLFFEVFHSKKRPFDFSRTKLLPAGRRWLFGLAGVLSFISLLYIPGTFKMPEHAFPLSYFWDGFTAMAAFSGHPTYFLGELSSKNHLAYYPLALLLKCPLTLLIFLLLSAVLAAHRKIKITPWYWFPGLVLFFAVGPFHNIGIREVLPVFPFLILTASAGAGWLWDLSFPAVKMLPKILVGGLFFFQAASLVSHFPGHASYFNEMVSPEKKIYWLGDSNLDMGQDTKRLAQFARQKGWDRVKLAYFGTADPELYGLNWDYWTRKDLEGPQPGWVYAVNAAFLQLGPAFLPGTEVINQSWLTQRPPTGMVGDTWYYFEIPPGQASLDTSPRLPSALPYKVYERLSR